MTEARMVSAILAATAKAFTAGRPLIYVHANEDVAPAVVMMTATHFRAILDLVPEGDEITSLVMAHTHVTGDAGAPVRR